MDEFIRDEKPITQKSEFRRAQKSKTGIYLNLPASIIKLYNLEQGDVFRITNVGKGTIILQLLKD